MATDNESHNGIATAAKEKGSGMYSYAQRSIDRVVSPSSRQHAYDATSDFASERPILFVRQTLSLPLPLYSLTPCLVLHCRPTALLLPPHPPLCDLFPLHRRFRPWHRPRLCHLLDRRRIHGARAHALGHIVHCRPGLGLGSRKLHHCPMALQPHSLWSSRDTERY
jgi:hypothetical protein